MRVYLRSLDGSTNVLMDAVTVLTNTVLIGGLQEIGSLYTSKT